MKVGEKLVSNHCPFCSICCGLYLSVGIGGRVKGIEPRTDFPINEGALCPRGITCHHTLTHNERLKTPLIRDGQEFRKTSWDEALEKVGSELSHIIKESGPQAIGFYAASRLNNETIYLFKKLASEIGSPNIDLSDRLGTSSASHAYSMALGSDRAPNPLSDLLLAEVIIAVGSDIASCHPILMRYLFNAKDRGTKIIVIDPRRTQTAAMADIHLRIRPGTDLALLNGVLNVVAANRLIDDEFISNRTTGFEDVKECVSNYTPTKVSSITGLREEQIIELAKFYGRARSAMILHTRGIEQHVNGVNNVLGCINLALATGKIGRPGCGCISVVGHVKSQATVFDGMNARRMDMRQGHNVVEMMEAASRGEIKAMYILASNPLISMPDLNFVKTSLEGLRFLIVQDVFVTETSKLAKVVLPGSSWAESEGTISCIDGRYVKMNKAVNPPGESMEDWVIICRLAGILGVGKQFEYHSTEEIFNEMKSISRNSFLSYSGLSYNRLTQTDGIFLPCPDEDHRGTPRMYEDEFPGEDGLAVFHPVEYSPPPEQPSKDYPFILTTFKTGLHFLTGTQTMKISFFTERCPNPYIEINPQAASKLGISNGDVAVVKSRTGEIKVKVELTDSVLEDCVAMPFHWGGNVAANLLTSRSLDPISGIPAYKYTCVSISKS